MLKLKSLNILESKDSLECLRKGKLLINTINAHSFNIAQKDTIMSDVKVLHQNIDTTSPAGRLLFTMLGASAEFERDLINERVREGIEAAKKKGVQFGRKAILD